MNSDNNGPAFCCLPLEPLALASGRLLSLILWLAPTVAVAWPAAEEAPEHAEVATRREEMRPTRSGAPSLHTADERLRVQWHADLHQHQPELPEGLLESDLALEPRWIDERLHDPTELHRLLASDPLSPSLSVGKASGGRLLNGVPLKSRPGLRTRDGRNWGTAETVAAIHRAVDRVRQQHPNTPDLAVGDLSRKRGGRMRPHKSHQSGRDADIAYYVKRRPHPRGLTKTNRKSLDVARSWALIEGLLEAGVEYMFIDYKLQKPLYNYAKKIAGKDEAYLNRVFSYPRGRKSHAGIIRHLRGHATHLHVRFHSAEAVAAARRLRDTPEVQRALAKARKADRGIKLSYKVRKGDNLIRIARRHGLKAKDIKKWNGLKTGALLRPGQRLTIYRKRVSRKSRRCRKGRKGKRKRGCPRT